MKAKKLLALLLALAMLVSCFASVPVFAADYTYVPVTDCNLTKTSEDGFFKNNGAYCGDAFAFATGMTPTFGVEPAGNTSVVVTATVPEDAETLTGTVGMCDNAIANTGNYNGDNYVEIYGVDAEGAETLLATTDKFAAAVGYRFSADVAGYTSVKFVAYNANYAHTDHITFFDTQFAVPLSTEDQDAADAVIAAIEEIPAEPTAADITAILEARSAYAALTATQKALVTNAANIDIAFDAVAPLLDYNKVEAESAEDASVHTWVDGTKGANKGTYYYYSAEGGTYVFAIRATCGGDARTNVFQANDNVATNVVVPYTGSWETDGLTLFYTTIELDAGYNEITFTSNGDAANTDYIQIEKKAGDALTAEEFQLNQIAASEILKFDFDAEDFTTGDDDKQYVAGELADGTKVQAVYYGTNAGVTATTDADGNAVATFAEGDGLKWTPATDAEDPLYALYAGDNATYASTFSVWVKVPSWPNEVNMFSYGADNHYGSLQVLSRASTGDWAMFRNANGSAQAQNKLNVNDVRTTGTKWHLITFVNTGTNSAQYWVDGVLVGENTNLAADRQIAAWIADGETNNDSYCIGAQPSDTTKSMAGDMDSFIVYNKALTKDEIQALYAVKYPISQEDLDAAAAVEALIDKIPADLTAADSNTVKAARAAYDVLTDAAKSAVQDLKLKALEDAEAALVGVLTYISLEVEEGVLTGTAVVKDADGASAGGFVGDVSEGNVLTLLPIYSENGGYRTVRLSYNSGQDRSVNISVNGGEAITLATPANGNWNVNFTSNVNTVIKLEPGANIITLVNPTGYTPNLDALMVEQQEGDSVLFTIGNNANGLMEDDEYGRNVTWNATINPEAGLDVINSDALDINFVESGAYVGVAEADVKTKNEEASKKIVITDEVDPETGDVTVYTVFGVRLINIDEAATTRAAQFYVTFELNDVTFTVTSDITEVSTTEVVA